MDDFCGQPLPSPSLALNRMVISAGETFISFFILISFQEEGDSGESPSEG